MADVSRETSSLLAEYAGLIRHWTHKINLIAPSTLNVLEDRHINNSAWIVDHAPEAESWVDVGSGAGLPGVVAAIRRPNTRVTCIEKDRRKCEFLRTVRRELGLDFEIIPKLLQDVPSLRPDIISARGLAGLERLFEIMHPHMAENTTLILPKGKSWQTEVDATHASWTYDLDTIADPMNPDSALLNIRNLERHPG